VLASALLPVLPEVHQADDGVDSIDVTHRMAALEATVACDEDPFSDCHIGAMFRWLSDAIP
jgi:hypothetical protein